MKVFVFDLLAYGKHFDQYKATKYLPYPLPGDHYDREVLQEAHVMSRGSEKHAVKSRALFPRREVYEATALSTISR